MNILMLLPDKPEDLQKKLEATSSQDIREAFAEQAGMTERDEEDSYKLRQLFKEKLKEILSYLPPIAKCVLWCIAVCTLLMLAAGTYYLIRDEKKLFDFIWNAIWATVIYLAAQFRDSLFKK